RYPSGRSGNAWSSEPASPHALDLLFSTSRLYTTTAGNFQTGSDDAAFWKKLIKMADWLEGDDPYYETGKLEPPGEMPPGVDRTSRRVQTQELNRIRLMYR
ncbi:hypothetical protein, partial [Ralstonia pseudosolanacearum]|uniref:hypothetical protein n=1 Tax=Ralstonia pseudosolanacearum TaxID=1310165 RepID=UPI002006B832